MSPRLPEGATARETVRCARLGTDDAATFERRRAELKLSATAYMRKLVRDDGLAHPEETRGNARTQPRT